MRRLIGISMLILLSEALSAQVRNPKTGPAMKTVIEGRPTELRLASNLTTTIRLPEPVSSVVIGDSSLFQAEYSPNEPLLVFARAVTANPAESNLVISTTRGRQFVLVLKNVSSTPEVHGAADLLVTCRPAGGFFIEDTFPDALVSETVRLDRGALPAGVSQTTPTLRNEVSLDGLIERQRRNALTQAYGDRIRVAIGEVMEEGSRLIVLFSVVNSQTEAVELVPPQVQLAGRTNAGIFRRARWTTAQQLPIQAYQMSARRLAARERVDGVVVFERPTLKQSTEQLLLQIADSAAVDQPALAPISFRQTSPREKEK